MSNYYRATGADIDWGSTLGQPPKTSGTAVKYTGGSGSSSNDTDWGELAQTGLQYLTERQRRERAKYEAQQAARAGMAPIGGGMGQYAPLIIGGLAIAAVILLTRKKS